MDFILNKSSNDTIRITQIYQLDNKYASFSGMPLKKDGHQVKSQRRVVYIKTSAVKLSVLPEIGQHWNVSGEIEKRTVDRSETFKEYQTHYTNPQSLVCTLPESGELFSKFVGEEKAFYRITEDVALEIWTKLKGDVYRHLENGNRDIFLKFLSEAKTNAMFKGFEKYKNMKHAKWLNSIGVPLHVNHRLLKYHGDETIILIKENPYILATFGMKFADVDRLAQEHFNIEKDDDSRLINAVVNCINQNESRNKHTVTTEKYIKDRLELIVGKRPDLIQKAIKLAKDKSSSNLVIYDEEANYYQSTSFYIKEKSIALRVSYLAKTDIDEKYNDRKFKIRFRYELKKAANINSLSDVRRLYKKIRNEFICDLKAIKKRAFSHAVKSSEFPLTFGQAKAVLAAIKNPITIITGGAGTGKTTVLNSILKAFQFLDIPIHCAAVSGRAAKRMNESTGYFSSTIAKLLREPPIEPDLKNHKNPAALVIDEASMIDSATMFRLINHIHPDTRILLIGDDNQLPAIGAGLVLTDLVQSGVVKTARLNEVKRTGADSAIPAYSKSVSQGKLPRKLSNRDVHFHECEPEDIAKICLDIYSKDPENSRITGAVYKPKDEIAGINKLNEICQHSFNSESKNLEFEVLNGLQHLDIKLNDPIIFERNYYNHGIQNGTLGKLIELPGNTEFGKVIIDTDEEVELTYQLLESIKMAYCISLHKAQGSQFPVVIVPVRNYQPVDRNWLYTAITRAKKQVHLVGPVDDFVKGIAKEGANIKRQTALKKFLLEIA